MRQGVLRKRSPQWKAVTALLCRTSERHAAPHPPGGAGARRALARAHAFAAGQGWGRPASRGYRLRRRPARRPRLPASRLAGRSRTRSPPGLPPVPDLLGLLYLHHHDSPRSRGCAPDAWVRGSTRTPLHQSRSDTTPSGFLAGCPSGACGAWDGPAFDGCRTSNPAPHPPRAWSFGSHQRRVRAASGPVQNIPGVGPRERPSRLAELLAADLRPLDLVSYDPGVSRPHWPGRRAAQATAAAHAGWPMWPEGVRKSSSSRST